jgi:acetoin utilization deacetylase AcuC-like enzyme
MFSKDITIDLIPQGNLAERIRAAGYGLGGVLVKTGIGTLVEEGKQVITVDGEDWLLELPIFADFALAADIATKDHGKKVAILDIDAHHGDGTENLTADNPDVLTYSIHERGIFPGTGNEDQEDKKVFNFPLPATGLDGELGKGDVALTYGVNLFLQRAQEFNPDLIFIACGADGHQEDPLSSLQYSVAGYTSVAEEIRKIYPDMPILMGGAGGYLPDSRTPEVWSSFAQQLSQ